MNVPTRDWLCHLTRPAGLVMLITLLTAAPSNGAERAGPSALFGRLVHAMSRPVLVELNSGLELPASTSRQDLPWAISLAVSMDGLWVEGKRIVELEQGQLPAGALDEHGHRIEVLFGLLCKVHEIEESDRIERVAEQTSIALQADRRLPYLTIWRVLASAAMAGYPDFHIVVLNGPSDLPTFLRMAGIRVSLPTLDSDSTAGSSGKVSLGRSEPVGQHGLTGMVQILDDRLQTSASGNQDPKVFEPHKKEILGPWSGQLTELIAWTGALRRAAPGSDTVVILPGDSVPWQRVIDTLDATRNRALDPTGERREVLLPKAVLSRIIPYEVAEQK